VKTESAPVNEWLRRAKKTSRWNEGQLQRLRRRWRLSLKDGAQSLFVETQFESVLLGESRDFLFSILFVYRPQALQFILVNGAVSNLRGFRF
jgi:hypothetical protein